MIDWPDDLIPAAVSFGTRTAELMGPPSLSGRSQSVAADAGSWIATLHDIPLRNRIQIFALRAVIWQQAGQMPVWGISPYDHCRSPAKLAGKPKGDRNGFIAAVMGNFDIRSTEIDLNPQADLELKKGQYIQINNRMYGIFGVGRPDADTYRCKIWPPLRTDVANSDEAKLEDPRCPMHMTAESRQMTLLWNQIGESITLSFEESATTD